MSCTEYVNEDKPANKHTTSDVHTYIHTYTLYVYTCILYVAEDRVRMERLMIDRVEGWNELGAKEKTVMMMDRVCRDEVVARAVEKMWKKRFLSSVSVPHRP